MIKGNKVVATLQVRMNSSRLFGKALLPLAGEPVLARIIERLRKSKVLDEIIVATTTNKEDDRIVELCNKMVCRYYRGSEEDVLLRILEAARLCQADIIVQSMADSPLIDWRHIDSMAHLLVDGGYDYATNEIKNPFPTGFDIRMYPAMVLEEVEKIALDPEYREHGCLYISTHPEKYRFVNLEAPSYMRWPSLRLTLDTKEDYNLISKTYDYLYPINNDFSAEDVIEFLKQHSELASINSHIKQKVSKILK